MSRGLAVSPSRQTRTTFYDSFLTARQRPVNVSRPILFRERRRLSPARCCEAKCEGDGPRPSGAPKRFGRHGGVSETQQFAGAELLAVGHDVGNGADQSKASIRNACVSPPRRW